MREMGGRDWRIADVSTHSCTFSVVSVQVNFVVCLFRSAEWLCAHVHTVPRTFLHVHDDLMVVV